MPGSAASVRQCLRKKASPHRTCVENVRPVRAERVRAVRWPTSASRVHSPYATSTSSLPRKETTAPCANAEDQRHARRAHVRRHPEHRGAIAGLPHVNGKRGGGGDPQDKRRLVHRRCGSGAGSVRQPRGSRLLPSLKAKDAASAAPTGECEPGRAAKAASFRFTQSIHLPPNRPNARLRHVHP